MSTPSKPNITMAMPNTPTKTPTTPAKSTPSKNNRKSSTSPKSRASNGNINRTPSPAKSTTKSNKNDEAKSEHIDTELTSAEELDHRSNLTSFIDTTIVEEQPEQEEPLVKKRID